MLQTGMVSLWYIARVAALVAFAAVLAGCPTYGPVDSGRLRFPFEVTAEWQQGVGVASNELDPDPWSGMRAQFEQVCKYGGEVKLVGVELASDGVPLDEVLTGSIAVTMSFHGADGATIGQPLEIATGAPTHDTTLAMSATGRFAWTTLHDTDHVAFAVMLRPTTAGEAAIPFPLVLTVSMVGECNNPA